MATVGLVTEEKSIPTGLGPLWDPLQGADGGLGGGSNGNVGRAGGCGILGDTEGSVTGGDDCCDGRGEYGRDGNDNEGNGKASNGEGGTDDSGGLG